MNRKNKINRRYHHPHKVRHLAGGRRTNKRFVSGIFALATLLALALLLLFSGQFVGKAFWVGGVNTGGLMVSSESPVLKNEPFALTVGANLKGNTKIISFNLALPQGLSCSGVTVKNLLPDVFQSIAKCENNKIIYEYYTLGVGDNLAALSGVKNIAEIIFPGITAGTYAFKFEKFNYFDLDLKQETNLWAQLFSLEVKECKQGLTLCNGKCIDLLTDKSNCGDCKVVCKDLDSCVAGKCVAQCTGITPNICNNVCVNIKIDMKNCGGCGKVCNLQVCEKGLCIEIKQCGNGLLDSGEDCDDPDMDSSGMFSKNCNLLGFDGGKIKCTYDCKFDTNSCGQKIIQEVPSDKILISCGNGLLDEGEDCDDPDMDSSGMFSKNCNLLGFDGGKIKCTDSCKFDTSLCNMPIQSTQPPAAADQAPAAGDNGVGGILPDTGADTTTPTTTAGTTSGTSTTSTTETTAGTEAGAGVVLGETIQQIKIALTEIVPASKVYSTLITATEDFTNEVTVYTVLYGENNKVLSLKLEKIESGLKKGASYTATVSYPLGNVKKKSVIIYDFELKPTVFGKLEKEYAAIAG